MICFVFQTGLLLSICLGTEHYMKCEVQMNGTLAKLPVYQPGRPIEEVARELGLPAADIIKLASNENPLGPSPKALVAMQEAINQVHLYPDGSAFYLKQHLAKKLAVQTEHVILGNGSNEVLEIVGHAFVEPGFEVVMSQYCFAVYPIVTYLFGGTPIIVPAKNYGHDLDAMLAAVTPKTRVMFVANPNNPTGTLASKAEMARLIEALPPHVLLVIDEAYIEFMSDPFDALSLIRSGKKANVLVARTFSKIYGLAGLRIGYGIASPEVITAMEKIREPFNTNLVGQAAALAALDDEEHMRKTRQNNQAGLDYYEKEMRALGVTMIPTAGNFFLINVGHGQQVFEAMQKLGVITRPMGGYKLGEWLRISVGIPGENERCVKALRQVLGK